MSMVTGSARRWSLLAAWLTALALLAAWNAFNIRPNTDLAQFLPGGASPQDRVLLSQLQGGVAARTLLLRLGTAEGVSAEPARLAAASRALAERLRDSGLFAEVTNGDFAATGPTDPLLLRYRYLFGPPKQCAAALDEPGLREALEQRLDELATGMALLDKQRLATDPTACYRALLRLLIPSTGPSRRHGVWVSPDHRHALLVAVTASRASDTTAQRRAIEAIMRTFAELPEAQGLTPELAGPGYFAVSSEQRIKTETILLSTVASVAVALILTLAFRSAALVALGLLPLASGLLVGAALVSLLFGSVHGITLALGVTLLGVALDYPVHVYAHAAGADARDTPSVWRTLLLGMATTVLGYAALAWTSFEGLSQLGILAGAGLVTAALTSRYLLPPLLPAAYRLPERRWLDTFQRRLPRLSPGAGLALLLVSLAAPALVLLMSGEPWDSDLRRLSVIPQSELDKDRLLRAQLGAPDVAQLLYLVADDEAAVLEGLEAAAVDLDALVDLRLIGGFDSAVRLLPSPRTQQARQAMLPDLQHLGGALAVANTELPFRLERLRPFLTDVQASRTLPPLQAADLADSLIGTRIGMLLQPFGEQWLGLVPLSGVGAEGAVGALHDLAARHGMAYLDLRQGSAELLSGFFAETLRKLLIATGAILMTLALVLRSTTRLARVLLPIVIALSLTFLIILLRHGGANLFHLVSLLLVAGLAIDYSLFLSRPTNAAAERRRTLFSVSIGAGSSLAMFGLLALSNIPALHAIGFTVAVGTLCAYCLSLLLARANDDRYTQRQSPASVRRHANF